MTSGCSPRPPTGGYEQRAAEHEDELQKARDEQLEACCEWLDGYESEGWAAEQMRNACRPNPPSLKEQALDELDRVQTHDESGQEIVNLSVIRRALEALPD